MIIRTHSRTLFAIAYGILQNREEAEDVVQDSLVKAWKTRWRVRDPEKFPAWLATIARHARTTFFANAEPFLCSERLIETDRTRAELNTSALDQQIALRARRIAGTSSRRAHAALFRRDGLPHDRKQPGSDQWRAARNSRPRSGFNAQTTSPGSRFNGLNLWQPFTTKLTTGSPPICTASFLRTNGARCMRISSIALRAEKLIRKPKL